MTEIQRLLTATIDDLNTREKRDNRPRFSISFIRKHPGLFVAMYAARLATLIVMLKSETLVDSVWLLVVLFVVLTRFSFSTSIRVTGMKISTYSISRVLQRGVVNPRYVPKELIDSIRTRRLSKPAKEKLQKNGHHQGPALFYDVFTFPAPLLRN